MGLTLTVTTAGRAALVNASNTGTAPVTIAQVGLTGTAVTPDPAATALPGEFKRIATLSGDVVADDTIHLIVRDETGDVFTVRSLALYLGDGTLFAIYGQADVLVEKSAQALMLLAIDVQFADVDAAELTFGDANFLNPPATTEQMGVVELSTLAEAIGGSSATRVPAEKMVKDAVNAWLDARFGANNAGIWHPGNDGAGSGLDADLLDGQQGSWYSNIPARLGYNPVQQGTGNGQLAGNVIKIGWSAGSRLKATVDVTDQGNLVTDPYLAGGGLGINGAYVNRAGNALWGPDNDGAGSGLDADLLDGLQSSAFARRDGVNLGPVNLRIDDADFIVSDGTDTPSHYIWRDWDTSTLFIGTATAQPKTRYDLFTDQGNRYWHAGNDGSGSGLDADLLDGLHGSAFARIDLATRQSFNGNLFVGGAQASGLEGGQIDFARSPSGAMTGDPSLDVYNNGFRMLGYFSSGVRILDFDFGASGGKVWHAGNDGSGSGLDADLLDGQHGSYYADIPARLGYTPLSKAGGTMTGPITFSGGGGTNGFSGGNGDGASYSTYNLTANVWWGLGFKTFDGSVNGFYDARAGRWDVKAGYRIDGTDIWHPGNDGSGSGLDADLLDGQQGSYYADIPARLGYTPVQQGGGAGQGTSKVYMGWGGSRLKVQVDSTDQGNVVFDTHVSDVWRSSNDGSGSGLDADLLDGLQAAFFQKAFTVLVDTASALVLAFEIGGVTWYIQTGTGYCASNSSTTITYPQAFSNRCFFSAMGGTTNTSTEGECHNTTFNNTTGYVTNSSTSGANFTWLAIGR